MQGTFVPVDAVHLKRFGSMPCLQQAIGKNLAAKHGYELEAGQDRPSCGIVCKSNISECE